MVYPDSALVPCLRLWIMIHERCRCGLIKAFSGRVYLPMPTPVREGQQYFVDKQAMVITRLPPELAGGRDRVEIGGTEAGSGGGTLLSGIMTHSKDRGFSGVPAFLTFTLDRPAMVGYSVKVTAR